MILFSYLNAGSIIHVIMKLMILYVICFPLSKKKQKQGCGIYVMIRKSIAEYVKINDI